MSAQAGRPEGVSGVAPGAAVRVFISYAHDSPEHEDQVRQLWFFLREHGLDATIDLPAAERRQHWPSWMNQQIREARYVLLVASPAYRERAEARAPAGQGRGVQWESRQLQATLYEDLYEDPDRGLQRLVPVVLPGGSPIDLPDWLTPLSSTVYTVADFTVSGAERLLRLLTDQPSTTLAAGRVPVLPAHGQFPGMRPPAWQAPPRTPTATRRLSNVEQAQRRIFISYAGADRKWAIWVGAQLRAAGFQVELDIWSWPKGSDFMDRMNDAIRSADHTVVLFSPSYFDRNSWARPELSAVFLREHYRPGFLIPVKVEPVDLASEQPVYASRVFADLVGKDPESARRELLEALTQGAADDPSPEFPGVPGLDSRSGTCRVSDGASNLPREGRADLLITFCRQDRDWASWASWHLERAGHHVMVEAWDATVATPIRMIRALDAAELVLPIATEAYLSSPSYSSDEWEYVLSRARVERQRLLPVLVERVALPWFFRGYAAIDLSELDVESSRDRLLAGVGNMPRSRAIGNRESASSTNTIRDANSNYSAPHVNNRRTYNYEAHDWISSKVGQPLWPAEGNP